MARISLLPLSQDLTGAEVLPIVQAGVSRRMTLSGFLAALTPSLNNLNKGDRGLPGTDGFGGLSLTNFPGADAGARLRAAAAAMPARGGLIDVDPGETLRFLTPWANEHPNAKVRFNGATIASYVDGAIQSNANGLDLSGFNVVPDMDVAGKTLIKANGSQTTITDWHTDGVWRVVDILGGNNITVKGHAKNTLPGGAPITIGSYGYCGIVDIDLFAEADPAYANVAECGIKLMYCDVVNIFGGKQSILQHNANIKLCPDGNIKQPDGTPSICALVTLIGVTSDTAVQALLIKPVNGGQVIRPTVQAGWYGVMQDCGIRMDATDGIVEDPHVGAPLIEGITNHALFAIGPVSNLVVNDPVIRHIGGDGIRTQAGVTGTLMGGDFTDVAGKNVAPEGRGFFRYNQKEGGFSDITTTNGVAVLPTVVRESYRIGGIEAFTGFDTPDCFRGRMVAAFFNDARTLINGVGLRLKAGTIDVTAGQAVLFVRNDDTWFQV